jgi:hypothetical protein
MSTLNSTCARPDLSPYLCESWLAEGFSVRTTVRTDSNRSGTVEGSSRPEPVENAVPANRGSRKGWKPSMHRPSRPTRLHDGDRRTGAATTIGEL